MERGYDEDGEEIEVDTDTNALKHCESLLGYNGIENRWLCVRHFWNGLRWEEHGAGIDKLTENQLVSKVYKIQKQAYHNGFRYPTLGA